MELLGGYEGEARNKQVWGTPHFYDKNYLCWTASGEKCFKNFAPYAWLGYSPWFTTQTNCSDLPFHYPVNIQIIDLLLAQGEYGIIIYAFSETTIKKPGTADLCKYVKKKHK